MKGKTLRLVDKILGSLLYAVYGVFSKIRKRKAVGKKLLAIKLWAIGESILILPALKALHAKGYKISVLCTAQNSKIFEGLNFIDNVFILDLGVVKIFSMMSHIRKRNFGTCIDFEPYTKFSAVLSYLSGAGTRIGFSNRPLLYTKSVEPIENIHAVKNFINLASEFGKIPYPKNLVELSFSATDKKSVEKLLDSYRVKKYDTLIGVHAGSASSSTSRRWETNKFAGLCDVLLKKYNAKIILIGSDEEKEINEEIYEQTEVKEKIIDLSGKIGLKELIYLVTKLDLFIANDSGPMHVSSAMGTPTIGLFGPNLPERYGPYGKNHKGIYKGHGTPAVRPFKGVFSENFEIKKIEVNDVLKVADSILRQSGRIRR
jgi:heptosyltransferase-2